MSDRNFVSSLPSFGLGSAEAPSPWISSSSPWASSSRGAAAGADGQAAAALVGFNLGFGTIAGGRAAGFKGRSAKDKSAPVPVYSEDPARQAATAALVAQLADVTENEPTRCVFCTALSSSEAAALLCWDAPLQHSVDWSLHSGTLLSVMLMVFGNFAMNADGSRLSPEAGGWVVDAIRERPIRCTLADPALDDHFNLLSCVLKPEPADHALSFRCALLRVLLERCGAAPLLVKRRSDAELPYVCLSEWHVDSSGAETACADACELICQHAPQQCGAVLSMLVQASKPKPAVLMRLLLAQPEERLRAIDFPPLYTDQSEEERDYRMDMRACTGVWNRCQQWHRSAAKGSSASPAPAVAASSMSASSSSAPSPSFREFQSWLRTALASLPSLLVARRWLLRDSTTNSAPGFQGDSVEAQLATPMTDFSALLPQFSVCQLMQIASSAGLQFGPSTISIALIARVIARPFPASLLDGILERIEALTAEISLGRYGSASTSTAASVSQQPEGRPILSTLDPCGFMADSPQSLLANISRCVLCVLVAHTHIRLGDKETHARVHRLLSLLLLALRALRPSASNPIAGDCNPLAYLARNPMSCSLSVVGLFHAHGVTTDPEGRSFTALLVHLGSAAELREWLSPAYAAHSMPNDWLAERITRERSCTAGVEVTFSSDNIGLLAAPPEPPAPSVFLCEALQGECWRHAEESSSFGFGGWDGKRLCAMLHEAIGWWQTTQLPKLRRAVEVHLIPDLAHEVISFLTPAAALPARAAPAEAGSGSSSSSSPATISSNVALQRLISDLQQGPVPQSEIVSQLRVIAARKQEEDEDMAGALCAQRLALL